MDMTNEATPRRIKSVETRRRLLTAGMAAFAESGYHGASVRDIVARSGHTVNAVSFFYGSKEGLAKAIVAKLKQTVILPEGDAIAEIRTDEEWRAAVRRFAGEVIEIFLAKDEPNCYFSALYRHESANLHAKDVTLHEEIVRPLFRQFESLMSLGVEGRDPVRVRLVALPLWNNLIAFALKHPDVLAADVPPGIAPARFREMLIDDMVERTVGTLRFATA